MSSSALAQLLGRPTVHLAVLRPLGRRGGEEQVLGDGEADHLGHRLVGHAEPELAWRALADAEVSRSPAISTAPSSGATVPLAMPSNVDLPEPFSPSRAWISPARNSIVMSSLAWTGPYRLETPRSDRTVGAPPLSPVATRRSPCSRPSLGRRAGPPTSSPVRVLGLARSDCRRLRTRSRTGPKATGTATSRSSTCVLLGEHPRLQLGGHEARRRAVGRDVGPARLVVDLLELAHRR